MNEDLKELILSSDIDDIILAVHIIEQEHIFLSYDDLKELYLSALNTKCKHWYFFTYKVEELMPYTYDRLKRMAAEYQKERYAKNGGNKGYETDSK